LTTTSVPSSVRAVWTCPIDADASGTGSKRAELLLDHGEHGVEPQGTDLVEAALHPLYQELGEHPRRGRDHLAELGVGGSEMLEAVAQLIGEHRAPGLTGPGPGPGAAEAMAEDPSGADDPTGVGEMVAHDGTLRERPRRPVAAATRRGLRPGR
jgi:hypothetical protein